PPAQHPRVHGHQSGRRPFCAAEHATHAAVRAGVLTVRTRPILEVIALSLLCGSSALAQKLELVDRIVAVVNKEVVTSSELRERVSFAERELKRQGTPTPDRGVLERQVLERLILDKAQLQLAAESGLRVDELQLDRAIERIAENNNMTLAAFRKALEADGVQIDRFREEVRRQIVMQRLREREVDERIEVSESDVDLYLDEQKGVGVERVEYNIAH